MSAHATLPLDLRLRRFRVAVQPVLAYGMPRRVWSAQQALQPDKLQRRFYSILMRTRPFSLEDPTAFVRRRGQRCNRPTTHGDVATRCWFTGVKST